jgi:AraC family transcriptional regulator
MLNDSLSISITPQKSFRVSTPQIPVCNGAAYLTRPALLGDVGTLEVFRQEHSIEISFPKVGVAPHRLVSRHGLDWHGMGAEVVRASAHDRVDYSFQSRVHLLAAYKQGVRRDGESYVEGVPRSALRDVAKKLTLVPAGHEYREWHDPRIPIGVTYFYFDPLQVQIDSDESIADIKFDPRLFFEDATICSTVAKLSEAIDARSANRLYVEALGVILIHELIRLNSRYPRIEAPFKGGIAAWQQRIVTTYIEEHLSEQISLAKLAGLTRLSTFHFCRAFKQSFGVPPHRYHTNRRIEQAKIMLAERRHSVTEVGLALGFGDTSSFTAVFRKITGQTPSRYHRSLA